MVALDELELALDADELAELALDAAEVAELEAEVTKKRALLDIAIREAIPDLLADREAFAGKLYSMYGMEYTSPYEDLTSAENKEDFNLKDKKTVEQ